MSESLAEFRRGVELVWSQGTDFLDLALLTLAPVEVWVEAEGAPALADGLADVAYALWKIGGREEEAAELALAAAREGAADAGLAAAEMLLWMFRPEAAAEALATVTPDPDADAEWAGRYGQALLDSGGDAARAEVHLLRAFREHEEFRSPLAMAVAKLGRPHDAYELLRASESIQWTDAWLTVGNALSQSDDRALAEAAYREAIALGDGHAAHNLAIDLLEDGRTDEAIELLHLAVARGDECAQGHLDEVLAG